MEEVREVDVHFQQKLKGSAYDFLSTALYYGVPPYYVPFRSLYSRNIDNLMMAGRCFSCTHVGLGGPRVMCTTGQMGVAVGYAASLCKQYNTTPRGVYAHYLAALKKLVYKSSQPLPDGWPEKIGPNLAPSATVTVSSNYNATTYPKSNLNDGKANLNDNTGRWLSSASSMPDTIVFAWTTPHYVSACRIFSGYKNGSALQDAISGFKFQYFSGGAWVDVPNSGATSNTKVEWFGVFEPVKSTRFRVVVFETKLEISRIWEIELYHPKADLSDNGRVDLGDFSILASNWINQGTGLTGDLVPDMKINQDDLMFLNEFWLWPSY